MLTDHQFSLILESFGQKEKIKLWLDEMKIENYQINEDLTVDVNGNVGIGGKKLKEIPVQFNKVSGDFLCFFDQLTTLEGAPKNVGDDFYCSYNQLTTLKDAPKNVGDNFYCSYNQLITLDGAPENVGGNFWCPHNQLTTLNGAPRIVDGDFWCYDNPLKSLEGKPDHVGGKFLIDSIIYNRIIRKGEEWSLDDIEEIPAGNIDIKDEIY